MSQHQPQLKKQSKKVKQEEDKACPYCGEWNTIQYDGFNFYCNSCKKMVRG